MKHEAQLKVLVVDDNATNLKVTRLYLKEYNYAVETASNGKMAISILSKEKFDIVLMDIEMPVMNGIEATRIIRSGNVLKENVYVPIIAITAHHREETDELLKFGITTVLSKPINYPFLQQKIEDICNSDV